MRKATLAMTLFAVSMVTSNGLIAAGKVSIDEAGTIEVESVQVPVSNMLTLESQQSVTRQLRERRPAEPRDDLETSRSKGDAKAKLIRDAWLDVLPSTVEDTHIDGVHVHVVTPKDGVTPKNKNRVLINAHSGGFMFGGTYGGQIEAIPMAGYGRVKVIAVDYRMAPEHLYPAASEDMEAVYRHVLKSTPAENIGIFGCSAGGTLAAQMVPWLESKKLPLPGAIGLFCSGIVGEFWYGGDSQTMSAIFSASPTGQGDPAKGGAERPRDYFSKVDKNTPMIRPGEFPKTLALFPSTLVVTGSRDISMSNALISHSRLLEAGVRAELFVQEGLGHGAFAMMPGVPESATAHRVIWSFFDRQLKQ